MQAVFIIGFSARSFHNVKAWKWFKLFLGASFVVSVSSGVRNGPKMRCTKFYEKSMHPAFLIFCMNLQQHKGLKLNQMFFWETSYAGVFEQKRGPKWVFLRLTTTRWIYFSWFFVRSCSDMKAEKWVKLFWQNSYFRVFGAKRPQKEPKTRFFKSYGKLKHDMLLTSAWGYSCIKAWNHLKELFFTREKFGVGIFWQKSP